MQEKNMGHICPIGRSGVNVNEVELTDESKLDTVRKHLSQDETLLTVRDYSTAQLHYPLTRRVKQARALIVNI